MTDEAISPLRRRMIEDMTIRKLAAKTQHDYVQGSRISLHFSADRPPLPTRKMCAAINCIWHRTVHTRPRSMYTAWARFADRSAHLSLPQVRRKH
jgi:hypothetical protein